MDSLKRKHIERPFNRRNSKKCWTCGSEEYLKDCPELKANKTRQDKQGKTQPRTTGILSNGSGMYIKGTLQGRKINFLIDTGASVAIINHFIYEQMFDIQRPYLEPAGQEMKMADGKCIHTRCVLNPSENSVKVSEQSVAAACEAVTIDIKISVSIFADYREHCINPSALDHKNLG
ncbi:hypothetical protein CHS0354_030878 [Potamilus streckersoni]|uniref:Uncharacterized protein n=1 Tax=Potamilus streckersoni TaxID=2493646 RepID=A0AAE0W047_9BIVA|nr:hypothetical protein CHS0354_030878 [Potamilus streckersoni]